MKIVLDVSAAFALITNVADNQDLLAEVKNATQVYAPDLFYAEATNTAWKFHHIKSAPLHEVIEMANLAIQLIDVFIPSEELWSQALKLACDIGHPAYDCFYLILARQEKAVLITYDKRLRSIAKQLNIETGPK